MKLNLLIPTSFKGKNYVECMMNCTRILSYYAEYKIISLKVQTKLKLRNIHFLKEKTFVVSQYRTSRIASKPYTISPETIRP